MIPVSDIQKLLDMIPVWKTLKELPGKVANLEARLSLLEKALAAPEPAEIEFDPCPKCRQPAFELVDSKPNAVFRAVGGIDRTYRCSKCGFSETKMV